MAPTRDKWVRRFVITETSRHRQGFTVYKITSLVFLKSSPDLASKVSVWKRYNDLKKLHKSLNSIHQRLNIKEPFPPFPKGKYFSRFEIDVIKDRRECALKLLEFISRHQSLATSETFVKFFETSLQPDTSIPDSTESMGSDTSEESQTSPMTPSSESVLIPHKLQKDSFTDALSPLPVNPTSKSKGSQKKFPPESPKEHPQSDIIEPPRSLPNKTSPILHQDHPHLDLSPDNEDFDLSKASQNALDQDHQQSECPCPDIQDFEQYVLIAAAHMSAGYRHESMSEYEDAFMQYKLGITNLLHGVQIDPDAVRRRRINEKIKMYTERAETLYNRYLNSNIALLSRPSDELKNYKVIKILKSVMLVRDTRTNVERIIKTVEKVSGEADDISNYILRGKTAFIVKLQGFVQTETTVFLILNYVRSGRLFETIKKRYGVEDKSSKRGHVRSASDDAVFRIKNLEKCEVKETSSLKTSFYGSGGIIQATSECRDLRLDGETAFESSVLGRDVATIELLEKAQLLLKSVDATIRKSNSIADKLDDKDDFRLANGAFSYTRDGDKDDSELSISDCSSGTFEKIDPAEVSNYFTDYYYDDGKNVRTRSDYGIDASEDSGVEMEQELWKIPENIVRQWTAQMITTLEFLHRQNVIMKNLRPQNLLIDERGGVIFSYVVPIERERFRVEQRGEYTAPELCNYSPDVTATEAADVWSFGVILYELLTGMEFQTRHPGPYYSHSILSIPSELSVDAKSLLKSILIFEPSERLSIKQIKRHSFYRKIEWETIDTSGKSLLGKIEVLHKSPV